MSIRNVAVVGAGGRCGRYIAEALLQTGQHSVTAITRADSKSSLPAGLAKVAVDYSNHAQLVEALRGQDALVITMASTAPDGADVQAQLFKAAAEAKVSWVLPSEWGPPNFLENVPGQDQKGKNCEAIAALGLSFIQVHSGFWYSWSLGIANAFGIDLVNRKVTFYDDGNAKINTSTWEQVGRTVAALFCLPIEPVAGGDPSKCLAHFRNSPVRVESFCVSQRDMFESALRVTGTEESNWTISYQPSQERYEAGLATYKAGDRMGFVQALYAREFLPGEAGNFGKRLGLHNELLGLPQESIDKATREALERARTNPWA